MKLLHTSDWHVGKKIRGQSRADEHRAVLDEVISIAESENVDLVVVAGDLYETAAPTPESERIVYRAMLDLADIAPVVAIAGNHDNPRRLEAIGPLLKLGRIHMVGEARGPEDGGSVIVKAESGAAARVALLPFVSQRAIVRAADLMVNAGFENAQTYADRMQRVVAALCAKFDADHVNLVVAHAFVHGGSLGGGERAAHIVDEYAMSTVDFPSTANYVALGHLHRAQQMLGPTAIHYCGSPLQLDFGEQEQSKQVNIVEAEPGIPAKVRPAVLQSGRRLRTLTGTVAELASFAGETGDDWLRVRVVEPGRVGLADEVRELLGPGVVDVRVDSETTVSTPSRRRDGREPTQMFADYLSEQGIADRRLEQRFAELQEEALEADSGCVSDTGSGCVSDTGSGGVSSSVLDTGSHGDGGVEE